jgi:hypothetical protein
VWVGEREKTKQHKTVSRQGRSFDIYICKGVGVGNSRNLRSIAFPAEAIEMVASHKLQVAGGKTANRQS